MNTFTENDIQFMKSKCIDIRKEAINMIYTAEAGHPGASLSEVEILVALYYNVLNVRPHEPLWLERDRFVLSKGHGCPSLYAILADKGYYDKKHLKTLRKYGSILQGFPNMITPGIDMASGSLGNGLSAGVGMAMAGIVDNKDYDVYVLLGDGELQEGLVWEAAMCAAHHKLKHLVAIVDYNGIQINGWVNDVMSIEPLADKWKAFGWRVIECDGHDIRSLLVALHKAKKMCAPSVLLAHTVKGKGVSFMEDNKYWHGTAPTEEEARMALAEIVKGDYDKCTSQHD